VLNINLFSSKTAAKSKGAMSGVRMRALSVQEQSGLEEWEGTFQDFAQMVIQFGYVALFAPACSLAPLLAFINNVTEIRSDAYKVCSLYKRGPVVAAHSIGAWGHVIKALAITAVLVNATMLCFVGSQVADWVHTELDDETGLVRETLSIDHRWYSWQLWLLCLAMEHGVLLLRFGASTKASQVDWVEQEQVHGHTCHHHII
jgi:hypothetical protein